MTDRLARENHLLASLVAAEFALLSLHSTVVDMIRGTDLTLSHQPVECCWFPLSGLVSVISDADKPFEVEVGMVGRDGMTGIGTLFGDRCALTRSRVLVSGHALRIDADAITAAMAESGSIVRVLLAYFRVAYLQAAASAGALAHYTVKQRLARWLLMALDRSDGESVAIGHEDLSLILGVRRAGVTVALGDIAATGLIQTARRKITIFDRDGLAVLAGGSYRQLQLADLQLGAGVSSLSPTLAAAF